MSFPIALPCNTLFESDADAIVVVTHDIQNLGSAELDEVAAPFLAVDARIAQKASLLVSDKVPGKRLVIAPTGPLDRDYDDVRRYFEAAKAGILEAKAAGAVKPVLAVVNVPVDARYENARAVSFLGACQGLWQPLEAREYRGEAIEPIEAIYVFEASAQCCDQLSAIAAGQYAARDLCGTEPERMAPPRFADYCVELFQGSAVNVEVIADRKVMDEQYPLLSTVARASYAVERHHPRVVKMAYEPEGDVERTLIFVGKGLVYDTGGADLKVGGFMAGMSRDKGGAASVVGFMEAVAKYQPKGIKVIAYLAVVRNSIGSDCFVPDEIIESREGVRVRIGNTDAEGRLAMGDLLSEAKDLALGEKNPEIFTVATLTGHAARAMGPYSAYVENGPARAAQVSRKIADMGDLWADCAEVSRSRREDYDFVKPRTLADDVLSSNNAPSAVTARGHQFPMAFLAIVGGLDKHGCNAELPIPYVHMDIAGSGVEGGDWQHGKPTAATVASLFARYCI
ncbi:leucyl aminopeptidase family protein [Pseudoalteromonas sp. CO348]|uniref:M17 family metallopeptidase n=1 Tax=Pseudoalteromonas sp. CO348 TaxID=1777271 RepID=UPI001023A265|nr:leucyl aminopeptidase family protein [Pseudoalteromonas sp. CO348]RZG09046.1 leucyl aminopeptidase family protein [Pseudoalteromonas sp. CO348]